MNLFYPEKVVFDFINNLLYNKDKDKEIRLYFRLTLINKYLKSLPKKRKIEIFYDARFENPFKIKFPFISCFEDLKKRDVYLKEIKFLVDDSKYRYCYCACKDCDCNCVYYRIDCDKYCIDCDCDCDDIYNLVCLRDEEYFEENYEEIFEGDSIICKRVCLSDEENYEEKYEGEY